MSAPHVIILLGGKGTRIAAHFPDRPKALVPVCNRPFLEWQLDWCRSCGLTRIHLAAGHKADVLEHYLAERPADGLYLTLSHEPAPLGTGGAIRYAADRVEGNDFLILNGDSLTPQLKVFHTVEKSFPLRGKLFVAPIEQSGRYGTVEFSKDGIVTAFKEKAEQAAGWINTGIYLLPSAMIQTIPAGRAISIETEIFPAWAAAGRLKAIEVPPPLLDMGTPDGLAGMETYLYTEGLCSP